MHLTEAERAFLFAFVAVRLETALQTTPAEDEVALVELPSGVLRLLLREITPEADPDGAVREIIARALLQHFHVAPPRKEKMA